MTPTLARSGALCAVWGFLVVIAYGPQTSYASTIPQEQTSRPPGIERRAENYGFSGLLVSKVNDTLFGLSAADFNGDSRTDLAAVDNRKSQITLFFQRGDRTAPGTDSADGWSRGALNELPDEVTFHRVAIPTDESVEAIAVGDLDGDGLCDLVYSGESGFVSLVLLDTEDQDPGQRAPHSAIKSTRIARLRLNAALASSKSLKVADLNEDGRLDIVVGTERGISIFPQEEPSGDNRLVLGDSIVIAGSLESYELETTDLNGDGHLDLITIVESSPWPFRIRMGRKGFDFTPATGQRLVPLRGYAIGDTDGDRLPEIVAIRRQSGRAAVMRYLESTSQGSFVAPLQRVDYSSSNTSERGVLVCDLEADGYDDLILSEGEASRLLIYGGSQKGLPVTPQVIPTLVKIFAPKAADIDGDGIKELIVASAEERAIGISRMRDGRLSLPEAHGIPDGKLIAFDLESTPSQTKLWLVLERGSRRSRKILIGTMELTPEGQLSSFSEVSEMKDLTTTPNGFSILDLDRAHGGDVLLSLPSEIPRIGLADAQGDLSFIDVMKVPGLGLLKDLNLSQTFFGDVDGDKAQEWLVPGPNFARAWTLKQSDPSLPPTPRVILQWGLDDANAKIGPVASIDFQGDGDPEIIVTDPAKNRLIILNRKNGEVIETLDLLGLEAKTLRPADIDGDQIEELIVFGKDGLGILSAHRKAPRLDIAQEIDPGIKDAFFHQIAIGDINGDESPDILMSELRYRLLQIMAFEEEQWEPALKFQIYEEKFFESGDVRSWEPREMLIADLDHDQRDDLVMLIHDRILIYPQDL